MPCCADLGRKQPSHQAFFKATKRSGKRRVLPFLVNKEIFKSYVHFFFDGQHLYKQPLDVSELAYPSRSKSVFNQKLCLYRQKSLSFYPASNLRKSVGSLQTGDGGIVKQPKSPFLSKLQNGKKSVFNSKLLKGQFGEFPKIGVILPRIAYLSPRLFNFKPQYLHFPAGYL